MAHHTTPFHELLQFPLLQALFGRRARRFGLGIYTDEFVDCLGEVAQYVHDKHGKFPGTITTIVLPGFVQAQHIDTEFYDAHYRPGAYLETHANHMKRWHGRGKQDQ